MRTRQIVKAFLKQSVSPDFELEGADEEFRPHLEAKVLEEKHTNQALLFIMNRSPHKGYSLRVSVKGYEPISVSVPAYDAIRQPLEPIR